MTTKSELEIYQLPTYFIDSNHPEIINKSQEITSEYNLAKDKAIALFYYVRDTYKYFPYEVSFIHRRLKASSVLLRKGVSRGYCTEKAILFAALCRACKIPNRLVFCNVRNHIGTGEIEKMVGTDLLVFHAYNEVYIDEKWVKCTVAFNKKLCDKINVSTLEFDGKEDQIFQEYDKEGGKFMEYVHEYGTFHEMPHDLWVSETKRLYPNLFTKENVDFYRKKGSEYLFDLDQYKESIKNKRSFGKQ